MPALPTHTHTHTPFLQDCIAYAVTNQAHAVSRLGGKFSWRAQERLAPFPRTAPALEQGRWSCSLGSSTDLTNTLLQASCTAPVSLPSTGTSCSITPSPWRQGGWHGISLAGTSAADGSQCHLHQMYPSTEEASMYMSTPHKS